MWKYHEQFNDFRLSDFVIEEMRIQMADKMERAKRSLLKANR